MFTIKLNSLVNAQDSLAKLITKELPIKTSYRLSKIISKVNSELKQFHKTRENLIKKYGVEDLKAKTWQIPDDDEESKEKYQADVTELLDVDVELSGFSPLLITEFEGVKISALDLSLMSELITDAKPDAKPDRT